MAKCCGTRTLLYIVTALQLISTAERQIFDFLGFMWIPIAGNFFNIIFVILGIFGIYQYHTVFIIAYLIWSVIWVAWNAFLICFYLNVGQLDNQVDILSFGTGSYSWWWVNGYGCTPDFFANDTTIDSFESNHHPPKPKVVTGCLVEYQYVEVTHACVQLVLGILALVIGCFVAHFFITVVDKKRKNMQQNGSAAKNMYSIEYSPQVNENGGLHTLGRSTESTDLYAVADDGDNRGHMTPRRVKRRSYTRSSARSASKAMVSNKSHHRSSTRSYGGRPSNRNKTPMNPVNRLIDDQHRHQRNAHSVLNHGVSNGMDSSTSNDESRNAMIAAEKCYGQINPGYQNSRPNSLYNDENSRKPVQSITDYEVSRPPSALTSYSNFHGQRRPLPDRVQPQSMQMASMTQQVNLTQESLIKTHNTSFDDDLPPPPPPMSSSPTGSSSQAAAQVPVPLQRTAPARRSRNEYVNMPMLATQNSNQPSKPTGNDMSSLISSSSPDSSIAPPLPPHQPNYVNTSEVNLPPPPPPLLRRSGPQEVSSVNNDRQSYLSTYQPYGETYNDTQTLRADDTRLQEFRSQNGFSFQQSEPPKQPTRQINIDYDQHNGHRYQHINSSSENTSVPNSPVKHEPPQSFEKTRVPIGNQRRENRSSLRAKHRKDMEDKMRQQNQQHVGTEDDYGFTSRPMGAPQHGGNCKCYRCQRKLTAI